MPVYEKYRDGYFVSISDSDCSPNLDCLATVYNGIDFSLYPFQPAAGDDLIFLGRIRPDKGVHLAIDAARRSGRRLLIVGIVQDESYFNAEVIARGETGFWVSTVEGTVRALARVPEIDRAACRKRVCLPGWQNRSARWADEQGWASAKKRPTHP